MGFVKSGTGGRVTEKVERAGLAGALVAPLFVVLWSTGFIGAKLGLPHAGPMTFLALRFALVVAAFLIWIGLTGARWPTARQSADAAIVGLLMHVGYLGGVFAAISIGIEAGMSALIVGLQPVLTAVLARYWLGERLVGLQWAGMALGVGGVTLVVWQKLGAGVGDWRGVLLCIGALVSISAGSVLQKSRGDDIPIRSGTCIQFMAAAVACTLLALLLETMEIEWTGEFVIALAWLVLVLSLGAVMLLFVLIRRGAASNVASLFFLVPPCTALIAWALFGERLGALSLAGLAATALGVLMVNRPALFGARRG